MFDIKNKAVIITGGAGLLGTAFSKACAEYGANVVIVDINEEKVRLKKHCEYFIETMDSLSSNGKKLGFISQEMGREINTLGAKANDQNIQKLVVQMKDELEKIKEQLFNIL